MIVDVAIIVCNRSLFWINHPLSVNNELHVVVAWWQSHRIEPWSFRILLHFGALPMIKIASDFHIFSFAIPHDHYLISVTNQRSHHFFKGRSDCFVVTSFSEDLCSMENYFFIAQVVLFVLIKVCDWVVNAQLGRFTQRWF
jgi:hypothetical protein